MAPRSFKDNGIVLIKATALLFPSEYYALQTGRLGFVFDNCFKAGNRSNSVIFNTVPKEKEGKVLID